MIRLFPIAAAIPMASLPIFASFILLAGIPVPGISLVPPGVAIALLALMACEVIYGIILFTRVPGEPTRLLGPLLLWMASGIIAAAFGFDPRGGMLFIGIFGLGIVWHVGISRYFTTPGAASATIWSLVISATLASLLAIGMVLTKHPSALFTIAHGRAVGTFVLPGELAGYLLMILPVCVGIALVTRRRALALTAWICVFVGTVAFLLTFSRTAFVAMGVELAVAGFLALRGRIRMLALASLVVVIGATLTIFNAHHDPSENFTRPPIWHAAVAMIERFPLTGVGPFEFGSVYQFVRAPDADAAAYHAHSIYLTLFAETGLVGFLAFAFVWTRFAQEVVKRYTMATPHARILGVACIAAFVGTLCQGLIDTVSIVLFGLWLPFMALTLALLRHGLVEDCV